MLQLERVSVRSRTHRPGGGVGNAHGPDPSIANMCVQGPCAEPEAGGSTPRELPGQRPEFYLGLRAIHTLLFAVMSCDPKRKPRTSKSSAVRCSSSWIRVDG